MPKNSYRFFQNKRCEYFPCHSMMPGHKRDFNCLFCYCPLYNLEDCGGCYTLPPRGIKDCSLCLLPHFHYDVIISQLKQQNRTKLPR